MSRKYFVTYIADTDEYESRKVEGWTQVTLEQPVRDPKDVLFIQQLIRDNSLTQTKLKNITLKSWQRFETEE
jgi:hypothetical protein